MSRRILIVDDDGATVERLDQALRRVGLDPRALTGALGLDRHLRRHPPAAILMAADLPEAESALRQVTSTPSVQGVPLLFYGHGRPGDLVRSPSEALAKGGDYFFKLPTDYDYLAGRVLGWLRTPDAPDDAPASAPPAGPVDLEAFAGSRPDAHPALEAIRQRQDLAGEDPRAWAWAEHLDEDEGPAPPAPEPADPAAGAGSASGAPALASPRPPPPDLAYGTKSSGGRALVDDARELERSGQIADAVEAYATAATLFQMDDELERAIRTYRHALELEPARTDLAEATVDLLLAEGRPNEAVELLSEAVLALDADGEADAAQRLRARLDGIRVPSTAVTDDATRTDDLVLTQDRSRPPVDGGREPDAVVEHRLSDPPPPETPPTEAASKIPPAATTHVDASPEAEKAPVDTDDEPLFERARTPPPPEPGLPDEPDLNDAGTRRISVPTSLAATDPAITRPPLAPPAEPEDALPESPEDETSDDLLDEALEAALESFRPGASPPAPSAAPDALSPVGDEDISTAATDIGPVDPRLRSAVQSAVESLEAAEAAPTPETELEAPWAAEADEGVEAEVPDEPPTFGPEPGLPDAPAPTTADRAPDDAAAAPPNPFFDDVEYARSRDLPAGRPDSPTVWTGLELPASEPAAPAPGPAAPAAAPRPAAATRAREPTADALPGPEAEAPPAFGAWAEGPEPPPSAWTEPPLERPSLAPTEGGTWDAGPGPESAEDARARAHSVTVDAEPPPPEAFGLPPIPGTPEAAAEPGWSGHPGAQPFDDWLATHGPAADATWPAAAADAAPELESAPPLAPLTASAFGSRAPTAGASESSVRPPAAAPTTEEDADVWSSPPSAPARARPTYAFRGLDPDHGRIEHPADAVDLLITLDRERCSGVLEADGISPIVFADGQPRDLRGHAAVEAALWGWTAPRGASAPAAAEPDGTRGLRRALRQSARAHGLSLQACDLAATQTLSQAMVQLLLHDGEWWFSKPEPPIRGDDLLPPGLDTQELLVSWVAQALPTEELVAALGGPDVRLKVSTRAPAPKQADLRRLFRALDGHRTFDQARREAHVAPARAAAQAAVWVWSGWTGPTRPPEPASVPAAAPPWPGVGGPAAGAPTPPWGWMPWAPWIPAYGAPVGSAPAAPAFGARAEAQRPTPGGPTEVPGLGGRPPHPEAERMEPSARIRHLADLARHADYFRILDVPDDAGPETVTAAHAVLVRRLTDAARDADPSLAPVVRELLRTLDEAREVLTVPEMREAYREQRRV